MSTLLWIAAVLLVIGGVLSLIRRQFISGAVLIVLGCLVGPGGISLFA